MQEAPSGLWMALSWLFNPVVLVGIILLLVFLVIVGRSQLAHSRQFLALTKYEMGTERKESRARLRHVRKVLSTPIYVINIIWLVVKRNVNSTPKH